MSDPHRTCGNYQHHMGCTCDQYLTGGSRLPAAQDAITDLRARLILVEKERDAAKEDAANVRADRSEALRDALRYKKALETINGYEESLYGSVVLIAKAALEGQP